MKQAPIELRFAAMAVDAVIFGIKDKTLHVLVQNVNRPPHYVNTPGFPGGLIDKSETAEEAVARHLADKGALKKVYLEQLYTFSALERDKRNRVISIGYMGCVEPGIMSSYQNDTAHWLPVGGIKKLAYDHGSMFDMASARLRGKLAYTTVAQFLLPLTFTLTELQSVYEVILGTTLDKRNFRKKILSLNFLKETGKMQEGVQNRPAALYSFTSKKLIELSPIV
jgi:8-oxo-dGTP diphosphatase